MGVEAVRANEDLLVSICLVGYAVLLAVVCGLALLMLSGGQP